MNGAQLIKYLGNLREKDKAKAPKNLAEFCEQLGLTGELLLCPRCENKLYPSFKRSIYKFCYECGQRLDWSGEDGT